MAGDDLVWDLQRINQEGWEVYEGSRLDSRAVLTQMPLQVKDGFLLDEVPWERFRLLGHGPGDGLTVKRMLIQACSADPATASRALSDLASHLFPDYQVNASAPLLVPFLLRLGVAPATPYRARTLGLAASATAELLTAVPADAARIEDLVQRGPAAPVWHPLSSSGRAGGRSCSRRARTGRGPAPGSPVRRDRRHRGGGRWRR
ncbi:hypothetical protein ABTZ03_41130 [Kitasatospora sp. NPDC096077]|uniref:hypothetical protein n=1 Tax=Kitasatospora sp. NPDC096077 TaxID=3155544 RepID=UPI0033241287